MTKCNKNDWTRPRHLFCKNVSWMLARMPGLPNGTNRNPRPEAGPCLSGLWCLGFLDFWSTTRVPGYVHSKCTRLQRNQKCDTASTQVPKVSIPGYPGILIPTFECHCVSDSISITISADTPSAQKYRILHIVFKINFLFLRVSHHDS